MTFLLTATTPDTKGYTMTTSRRLKPAVSITLLVIVALAGTSSLAQDPGAGRLNIGVGILPVQTVFEMITDVTTEAFSFGSLDLSTEEELPALYVEYEKPLGEHAYLAFHFNYVNYERKYRFVSGGGDAGAMNDHFYTLMVGLNRTMVKGEWAEVYVGAMAGVSILRTSTDIDEMDTESAILPAFQLTPLAVRVGKDFAIDLALGVGYKGILSAGGSVRF